MAGEHVGQVLQEPDRLDHPDRFPAPDLKVEGAVLFARMIDRRCQLIELAGDQSRAQVDPDPRGVHTAIDQARVGHRQLGCGDRQLDVAGHVLAALAQLLGILG